MSSSTKNRTSYNRNNNQTRRQDMNRSRSSHRNNSLYNDNYRSSSYDQISLNRSQQKTRYDSYYNRNRGSNIEDDYVDCKAMLDDECKRTDYVSQNRNSGNYIIIFY